jgi:hypothetical protein
MLPKSNAVTTKRDLDEDKKERIFADESTNLGKLKCYELGSKKI